MSERVLLGTLSRLPHTDALPWIRSFRAVEPNARVLLLTDDASRLAPLAQYSVTPIQRGDLWPARPKDRNSVWIGRWGAMRDILGDMAPDTQVITTDVRDAVFQRNPFEQLEDGKINVATEGLLHSQIEWGRMMVDRHFSAQADRDILLAAPIICAGVWAARADVARALSGDMVNALHSKHSDAEQHTFNLVLQRDWSSVLSPVPYTQAWAAHLSLMYGSRGVGHRFEVKPVWDGKHIHNGSRPFAIVHHLWKYKWSWPELTAAVQAPWLV